MNYSYKIARQILISALIQSTINHVIRVFPPLQDLIHEIESILTETLWSKWFHGENNGLPTIAKDRLHLLINKRGLGWNLMSSRAITCFFSSLIHTVKYKLTNTNSTLAMLCPVNGDKFFGQSSFSNLWNFSGSQVIQKWGVHVEQNFSRRKFWRLRYFQKFLKRKMLPLLLMSHDY